MLTVTDEAKDFLMGVIDQNSPEDKTIRLTASPEGLGLRSFNGKRPAPSGAGRPFIQSG